MMTSAGMGTVARNGLVWAGPALVGLGVGVCLFGNGSELYNLVRNSPTYSREMKAIKDEQYMS